MVHESIESTTALCALLMLDFYLQGELARRCNNFEKRDFNVNSSNRQGESPLHIACR